MNEYTRGTCEEMCPASEIAKRKRERLVHFYEENGVFVKEFTRSSAGQASMKPEELRTKQALYRSLEYLLTDIFRDSRHSEARRFDFIFDRMRSIRQELVIQNFDAYFCVSILEPIVMFLGLSLLQLSQEDIRDFDSHICASHLQECFKIVLSLYRGTGILSPRRCRVEAAYLLFNLGETEALDHGVRLPKIIRKDFDVVVALKMSLSLLHGNFYRSLKLMERLSDELRVFASLKLNEIRRRVLETFSVAYSSKTLTVPASWLQKLLLYSCIADLRTDLTTCRVEYIDIASTEAVKFEKTKFNTAKLPIRKHISSSLQRDSFKSFFLLLEENPR